MRENEQTARLEMLERVQIAQRKLDEEKAELANTDYTVADLRRDLAGVDGSLTIDLEGRESYGKCSGIVVEDGGVIMERAL